MTNVTRKWRKWSWLWPLAALFVAIGLQLLGARSPELVEHYYSRGIFKHVARTLGAAAGQVSFSLAELLGVLAVLAVVAWLVWQIRLLLLRRIGPADLAVIVSLRFAQAFSSILLLFLLV